MTDLNQILLHFFGLPAPRDRASDFLRFHAARTFYEFHHFFSFHLALGKSLRGQRICTAVSLGSSPLHALLYQFLDLVLWSGRKIYYSTPDCLGFCQAA
jgi:hypothetical protein